MIKESDYTFHHLYNLLEDDEEELEECVKGPEYIRQKRAKRQQLKDKLVHKMKKVVVKNIGLSRRLQNITPDKTLDYENDQPKIVEVDLN